MNPQVGRQIALLLILLGATSLPSLAFLVWHGLTDWALLVGAIDLIAVIGGVVVLLTAKPPGNVQTAASAPGHAGALTALRVLYVCSPFLVVGGGTWSIMLILELGEYEGARRTLRLLQLLFALGFVALGLYYYLSSIPKLKRQVSDGP